ncbi:MAG: alkB [Caulobacteraceae bacterium]|nr:alkB [Caulobacteraceae bacterium]
MSAQPSLFDPPAPALPEGFAYRPELITAAEEQALAARFEDLPFRPYEFQAYKANRLTVSFGWRYAADGRTVERAPPIPDWLQPVRAGAAAFAGLEPEALEQSLVIRYPPGAPIGWHRDRPAFRTVMGVSLLSPALLRLRLKRGQGWIRAAQALEPRSVYLLDGAARSLWQHSIPPAPALRYSITFRTLNPEKLNLFRP